MADKLILRPAWAEIDTTALRNNFRAVREWDKQKTGGAAQFAAIVKADAYGHGMLEVAHLLLKEGADWLAVATIPEGMLLRKDGIGAPILILGLCPSETFSYALEHNLTLPISSLDQAKALAETAKQLTEKETSRGGKPVCAPFFLVMDSGMGRIGLRPEAIDEACAILALPGITCTGIFTHFAESDDPSEKSVAFTQKQIAGFRDFVSKLKEKGYDPGILSLANSGACLDYPEVCMGLNRPGIILYGYHPMGPDGKSPIPLTPVMSVKAKLTLVKRVPAGTPIGYGCAYVTDKETLVGTVPVGYADGYPRQLSNKGAVLVNGKRCPIIGNVCMDQFMIDLSAVPKAKAWDEVVLLGTDGGEAIDADEIAREADTISFEILCGLGQRLERFYK